MEQSICGYKEEQSKWRIPAYMDFRNNVSGDTKVCCKHRGRHQNRDAKKPWGSLRTWRPPVTHISANRLYYFIEWSTYPLIYQSIYLLGNRMVVNGRGYKDHCIQGWKKWHSVQICVQGHTARSGQGREQKLGLPGASLKLLPLHHTGSAL